MSKPEEHEIIVHKFEKSERVRTNGSFSSYDGRWTRSEAGSRPYDPSRVFVDFEGETILDNINNRRARPYTTLKPLVKKALEDAGIEYTKIRWSQHAGCRGCPCSPGFIVETAGHDMGADYYLTVTDKTPYEKTVTILL